MQYCPDFIETTRANDLYRTLEQETPWQQDVIRIYGKKMNVPRLSAWYGDTGKSYTYSGITMEPIPWTRCLYGLKNEVEAIAQTAFNSVLINLYRDGNDSMGWHSDNEIELGNNPIIASVSLGNMRTFMLRKVKSIDPNPSKISLQLAHGSLLLMLDETQHYWEHQVPKTKKNVGPRINLTFRFVL
ncbi:alpha-ketoglutarate-dependent dioxygenase AlkB [Candidatus Synechococcus calcipolaris G9]|uniref:Alpha-ketoglutarate-dependent dioxygenase AlkB n=1 Tax=Candidatus Synechococcus calcipolaris G9 TaxID=1497997 RepID=A0ABT6F003_9SYNE|nr:alpha-ketoglutarate-dependent dioxygenase AlkB [Candidatus Synechococcus calcipolaris]MDG2991195.1 alpha-ketoglutarate-dependent dioxygenase AlkB [Candidatus Synechococcus calcipolaris G9]